jgi:3-oxoacyl-[acyl-carrier-protein] synthase III
VVQKKARIIGMGSYLPKKVLTNADLEKMVETSDEWITTRTGMKERRIAGAKEFSSTMGADAARQALERSGLKVTDIDYILVATLTPDYLFPSTAALIQDMLGATDCPAVDVGAACSGFLYALSMAKAFVESGARKNVLVIASEKLSSIVNYKDRRTCVLFGDGASAAVVSSEGAGLLIGDVSLGCDGALEDFLKMPAGGCRTPASKESVEADLHYIDMAGQEVFKHAVRRMQGAALECIERAGMTPDQVKWIVPHQANVRIIDAIAKRLEIPEDRIFITVHKYGNTSASAVAIALDELLQEKPLEEGDHLLLVVFGAGFTWGSCILTKVSV